jgi:hypothetical protein
MSNATLPAGRHPSRAGRPLTPPDYWDELGEALGLGAVDLHGLRRERSLVRSGVVFRVVLDDAGSDLAAGVDRRAGLAVSLPLKVCDMDRDHLLRLLQTNALMAQTVGLVIAAGPLGELNLVGTLGPQGPQTMARWIDAAAWMAQSMLGADEAPRALRP